MKHNQSNTIAGLILFLLMLPACSLFGQSNPRPVHGDLHLHPAIKPFNSRHLNDFGLWNYVEHDCPTENFAAVLSASEEVPKYTQSNFEALIRGNVRIAFVSLSPIEKEMRIPNIFKNPEKRTSTTHCIGGMEVTDEFFADIQVDYASDLWENIAWIMAGEGKTHKVDGRSCSYEVVRNAPHLQKIISDPNKIAVFLNIEGGHALGKSWENESGYTSQENRDYVMQNVRRLKGIDSVWAGGQSFQVPPVWFLTLNHFMWNGLSGHAKTFMPVQGLIFDQSAGLETGFTDLGKEVVAHLLSETEGRRVLVDVKHMSVASRKWYYDLIRALRVMGDTVPIIASHVGIAGTSWDSDEYDKKDSPGKNSDSWMHHWTISLAAEDIHEIHASGGVMGLMLDKYRICGKLAKEEILESPVGSRQRRLAYVKVIAANMLKVAEFVGEPSAWDIIAIGSDFDGMINAMENYSTSDRFPDLRRDLLAYFRSPEPIWEIYNATEVSALMYGLSPEDLVDKVMGRNLQEFALRMTARCRADDCEAEGLSR